MDTEDCLTEAGAVDTAETAKTVSRTIADALNAIGAEVAELRWNAPMDADVRLFTAVEQIARHAAVLGLAVELLDLKLATTDQRIATHSAAPAHPAGERALPADTRLEEEGPALLHILAGCPDQACKYLAGEGLRPALSFLHLAFHAAARRPSVGSPASAPEVSERGRTT